MRLKEGITKGHHFGGVSIPIEGEPKDVTAGGVPEADISAVKKILWAEGGRVSNTEINDAALAASGKEVEQVQLGGIDLTTVDRESLKGKAAYNPKGYYVDDKDVPQNANRRAQPG